ncbi:tripartite tricarboxylate transporter substrate binding protein [Achromobacter sp. F4_2707]|uniref:Bug family tripartite tricarboxylate transporter substrate binding protein n=1 Tax=Achromobacter sp. F4_2707 TaxID=3114286 RepID=UPI0039C67CA6
MSTLFTSRFSMWAGQAVLLAMSVATPAAMAADAFPEKAVRMVVPYPPGGPTDLMARGAAQAMTKAMGESIIVDNRAGASGMIGADQVARATPDGYTILANASLHVINPHIYEKMSYDSFEDFVPVTQLAAVPLVLVVPKDSPIQTVADAVELAKEKKGALNFGSAGTASSQHLSGELFKKLAGVDMLHIPYKGSSPALVDLVGGQLDLMFDSMPSAMPFIQQGQLRAVAVTTPQRVDVLADVPTMAESGFPTFDTSTWYALWAPKGTPENIVEKLASYAQEALRDPDLVRLYNGMGAQPVGSSPKEFAEYTRSEEKKWAELIRLANVPLQ